MQQMLRSMPAGMAGRLRRGADADEEGDFKEFTASELYCPKCRCAMPVRQKLLLVLSSGEMFDFVCVKCGTSLGTRKNE